MLDRCLATYNEARNALDELQLTFKFPGTGTVVVQAQATLVDATTVRTDPFIVGAGESTLVPALYTVLVQALAKALEAVRLQADLEPDDDDGDDEDWDSDDYEEETDYEEDAEEDEIADLVNRMNLAKTSEESSDLQQRFQQALDEEAERARAQAPDAERRVCPACSAAVQDGWKYCPECGASLN